MREIIISFLFIQTVFALRTFKIKSLRIKNCTEVKNAAVFLDNVKISQFQGVFKLDMDIHVTINLFKTLRVVLHIEKCKDGSVLDTCIRFNTLRLANVCEALVAKKQVWTPIMESVQPQVYCPVRKEIYQVRGAELDLATLTYLPVDNYFVSACVEVYNSRSERSLIMCTIFDSNLGVF